MKKNHLIELEKWNQSYNFDYNCMGLSAFILNDICIFLKTLNITKTIKEVNQFYEYGMLYNVTDKLKNQKCNEILGIDYSNLPEKYRNVTFSSSYGKNDIVLNSDSFKTEFNKYIKSLIGQMPKYNLLTPNIDNLDIEILAKAFLSLTDLAPTSTISFDSYIQAIIDNNFTNLAIICKIQKDNLKNPLIYKFILRLNAYCENKFISNDTALFISEFNSLWNGQISQKVKFNKISSFMF